MIQHWLTRVLLYAIYLLYLGIMKVKLEGRWLTLLRTAAWICRSNVMENTDFKWILAAPTELIRSHNRSLSLNWAASSWKRNCVNDKQERACLANVPSEMQLFNCCTDEAVPFFLQTSIYYHKQYDMHTSAFCAVRVVVFCFGKCLWDERFRMFSEL